MEQIDHLSKIAADFSQFANIGNVRAEVFDLHDVISSLRDLYLSNQQVEFVWYPVLEKLLINADKTQMNRLFTNLFTNAVEACRERGNCRIEVNEHKDAGQIVISIKDNGEGIAAEMQKRIFVPNFTTKSSGTGLGLAMCKGIVEQAKGSIWFETKQGEGTTFFVQLEAYGGGGADAMTNLVFAEALSQATFAGFIITVLVHTDMAGPHLHHAGNAAQKARYML